MKVYKLEYEDMFDKSVHQQAFDSIGGVLYGWITEEDDIFYCESKPCFCPITGKKLIICTE